MRIKFTYGPKNDLEEHVSREVGAALIAGGFAVEISVPIDPVDAVRKTHPAFGWVIQRTGSGYDQNFVLVRHDGMGGKQLFKDVPAPTRRWKYDPATGEEGYVNEPSDCPTELAAEFTAMKNRVEGSIFPSREKIQLEESRQKQQNVLSSEAVIRGIYANK